MYINSRHIYRRHLQGVYNPADCCIGSEDKKNHHCEACSELFNFFSSALIIKTWHLVTSKVIKTVILLHKLSEEKKTNLFLTFNICSYFTAGSVSFWMGNRSICDVGIVLYRQGDHVVPNAVKIISRLLHSVIHHWKSCAYVSPVIFDGYACGFLTQWIQGP